MVTKKDFGRFVLERRQEIRLTQRDLAARLHVTESAISKWERGLSYPDITLVMSLADELRVSSQELISASEDVTTKVDQRDARVYRRWRNMILWTMLIAYTVALLTCFIVNLSVTHNLTWFWTVLPAVALAFCLTTLPLLKIPHPGWTALAGAVVSLGALLLVCWLSYERGSWLAIACSAILFALIVIFGPISLTLMDLPDRFARHRTVVALGIDTLALLIFLLIVMVSAEQADLWASRALPIATIALVPVWTIALVIRYLPINGLGRAAIVTTVVGCCGFGITFAVEAILGDRVNRPFVEHLDLTRWQHDTISYNILMLFLIGCLLAAVVLGIAAVIVAVIRARRNRSSSGQPPLDGTASPERGAAI